MYLVQKQTLGLVSDVFVDAPRWGKAGQIQPLVFVRQRSSNFREVRPRLAIFKTPYPMDGRPDQKPKLGVGCGKGELFADRIA